MYKTYLKKIRKIIYSLTSITDGKMDLLCDQLTFEYTFVTTPKFYYMNYILNKFKISIN